MGRKIEVVLEDRIFELKVSGFYSPGCPASGPRGEPPDTPPEQAEIEDLTVIALVCGTEVDITDKISDERRAEIMEDAIEAYEDEQKVKDMMHGQVD